MFASSLLALAVAADSAQPTSGPPIFPVYQKPVAWFDESTAYACSYARLVNKDPVWRVNISFPFRGPASLALQTTKTLGSKTIS